jgi:hypothetical protein
MRNGAITVWLLLLLPAIAFGQEAPGATRQTGIPDDPRPFNPKELTGIWARDLGRAGIACGPECGDRGFGKKVPPMTPEGKKRFDANKPSYGRALGEPLKGEDIGRVRAVPPALGNDPQGECIPQGIPRHLLFPYSFEIMMTTDGRMVQRFEWNDNWRQIWMDGRKLPAVPVDLPGLYGYSVGRWDGNTLVVETVGLDDRTWVDHFGYPHSDETRLEERYRRIAYNKLELIMTLYDPKVYATPWVSDRKVSVLLDPRELKSGDGWQGLLELPCADLIEGFNKKVRDPVNGIR